MGMSEVGGRRWEETGDQKDEMRMEWDRKWGNDARSLAVLLDGRWMGARRLCGAHQLRVQHLLPAVQALHVRPKRHIQRDLLPVAAAVPGNRHTELRVLWGRRVVSARPVEQRRGSRASSWAGKRGADLLRRPLGLLLRAGGPAAEGKTLQWVSSMRIGAHGGQTVRLPGRRCCAVAHRSFDMAAVACGRGSGVLGGVVAGAPTGSTTEVG